MPGDDRFGPRPTRRGAHLNDVPQGLRFFRRIAPGVQRHPQPLLSRECFVREPDQILNLERLRATRFVFYQRMKLQRTHPAFADVAKPLPDFFQDGGIAKL